MGFAYLSTPLMRSNSRRALKSPAILFLMHLKNGSSLLKLMCESVCNVKVSNDHYVVGTSREAVRGFNPTEAGTGEATSPCL